MAIAAAVVEPVPRTVRLHFGDWRNAAIAGVELGKAVLHRQKKLAVVHHGEAANTAQHSMGAMISRTWIEPMQQSTFYIAPPPIAGLDVPKWLSPIRSAPAHAISTFCATAIFLLKKRLHMHEKCYM